MKTSLLHTHLAAALCCAGKQDVRFYLNSVFVEVSSTETRVVGCNGISVAVLRLLQESEAPFSVIIPRDSVELALRLKSEVLGLECTDGLWSLGGIPFRPLDGTYPDYRRTIPRSVSGAASHFDPNILMSFAKVGKALKCKGMPIVRQSGADAALVHFYDVDEFVGVAMPMRMFTEKNPDKGAPSWGPLRVAEKELCADLV